jgi:hypothetical protein
VVSFLVEGLLEDQVACPLEGVPFSFLEVASYQEEVHESAFLEAAFLDQA